MSLHRAFRIYCVLLIVVILLVCFPFISFGSPNDASCGDGVCDALETVDSCATDCAASLCGNGVVDYQVGESWDNSSCDGPTFAETYDTCKCGCFFDSDCPNDFTCNKQFGYAGLCECSGESCGQTQAWCGNDVIEPGESCEPHDGITSCLSGYCYSKFTIGDLGCHCSCTSDTQCGQGSYCDTSGILNACKKISCGDGVCHASEEGRCLEDCGLSGLIEKKSLCKVNNVCEFGESPKNCPADCKKIKAKGIELGNFFNQYPKEFGALGAFNHRIAETVGNPDVIGDETIFISFFAKKYPYYSGTYHFKSSDGGNTWSKMGGPFPASNASVVLVDKYDRVHFILNNHFNAMSKCYLKGKHVRYDPPNYSSPAVSKCIGEIFPKWAATYSPWDDRIYIGKETYGPEASYQFPWQATVMAVDLNGNVLYGDQDYIALFVGNHSDAVDCHRNLIDVELGDNGKTTVHLGCEIQGHWGPWGSKTPLAATYQKSYLEGKKDTWRTATGTQIATPYLATDLDAATNLSKYTGTAKPNSKGIFSSMMVNRQGPHKGDVHFYYKGSHLEVWEKPYYVRLNKDGDEESRQVINDGNLSFDSFFVRGDGDTLYLVGATKQWDPNDSEATSKKNFITVFRSDDNGTTWQEHFVVYTYPAKSYWRDISGMPALSQNGKIYLYAHDTDPDNGNAKKGYFFKIDG